LSQIEGEAVHAHGYFNIFFAALIAHRSETSLSELERIVSEPASTTPSVTSSKISWLGHSLSGLEIARLRATFVTSFGSCSFDEPIQSAVQHGWIS
jgi:hypothetical protein